MLRTRSRVTGAKSPSPEVVDLLRALGVTDPAGQAGYSTRTVADVGVGR